MFVMLLIGPQTTSMPGVQPVGRLAFAEMLEWEPEAFDKAFQEVFEQGLAKADWKARFVFVPKAIQHNLPQSPNVVKSWASTWARVPDCDLKREAWQTIFQALTTLGKSFADAFKTACPLDSDDDLEATGKDAMKASGKPSEKATDNQEQEQEKELQPPQPPRSGGAEPSEISSNKRERKPRISLKTFLDRCQQAGEKAVSAHAPLLEYVEATGLPMEFVQLAWDHFKREHLPPGANQARLQADWRRHFLAYVEKGYYRLWYAKPDGGYELTTVGIQAQRLHAAGGEHAA